MKKIVIYSFDVCPYCEQAKMLLTSLGYEYEERVITRDEVIELSKKTNMITAPQIFVDGDLVEGFDQLKAEVQNKDFINGF